MLLTNDQINHLEDTKEINIVEYNELLERAYLLSCLEEAGVYDWEGYDEAMHKFNLRKLYGV